MQPHVAMLVLNRYTNDTRVEKEAATLRDAGYAVTVVALADLDLPDSELRDGVHIRRVTRPSGPRFSRFLRLQRALGAALLDLEPTVIHCHDSEALVAGARTARAIGVPYVYDAHDLWLGRMRRGRSRLYWEAYRAYYRGVESRYLPGAAAWITVSSPIARHLQERYALPRVELVPNYPVVAGPPAPVELRTLPGFAEIPLDAPIVLYLGNVMSGRGVEQLVAAMRDVPRAHLALLGGAERGPLIGQLAAASGVGDRVHVAAPVPSERVIDYAATASVGVSPILPSCLNYRYSLPNKLFQYMAAGLPVVASNFDQVREAVEGSGAGLTVDPADPTAIAGALRQILDDEPRRAEMGARARAAVEDRYNWERSASVLRDIYRRVAPISSAGE